MADVINSGDDNNYRNLRVSDRLRGLKDRVSNTLVQHTGVRGVKIVVIITLLAIVAVIVSLAVRYIKYRRSDKVPKEVMASTTVSPSLQSERVVSKVPIKLKSETGRWAISFYLKVENFEDTTMMKTVFWLTPSVSSGASVPSMVVWLDAHMPRLWIYMRTTADTKRLSSLDDIYRVMKDSCQMKTMSADVDSLPTCTASAQEGMFLTVVDYVPLREWTNITIVVSGPFVSTYVNGSAFRSAAASSMVVSPDGNVIAMGQPDKKNSAIPTFDGTVSRFTTFDYAPNAKHIGKLSKGMAQSLPMPSVRNPFYWKT